MEIERSSFRTERSAVRNLTPTKRPEFQVFRQGEISPFGRNDVNAAFLLHSLEITELFFCEIPCFPWFVFPSQILAATRSAIPAKNRANMIVSMAFVPFDAPLNSRQMKTPQKAEMTVAPWPRP